MINAYPRLIALSLTPRPPASISDLPQAVLFLGTKLGTELWDVTGQQAHRAHLDCKAGNRVAGAWSG